MSYKIKLHIGEKKMATHLSKSRKTLNSRFHYLIRCTKFRPCKRMTCEKCIRKRREYFIDCGASHSMNNGLVHLVTVSWLNIEKGEGWRQLHLIDKRLSKRLSGLSAGPFIKVLSLGEMKDTPHVHYVVSGKTADTIRKTANKGFKRERPVFQVKPVKNIRGLLGYLFDMNIVPSYLDPERIKGIRVVSASRPMKCGFPRRIKAKKNNITYTENVGLNESL